MKRRACQEADLLKFKGHCFTYISLLSYFDSYSIVESQGVFQNT